MSTDRSKRILALGVALALAGSLLAGCGGGGDADEPPATPRNLLPQSGSPVLYEFYTDG